MNDRESAPRPCLALYLETGLPQAYCYGRRLEERRGETGGERHAPDHHRHCAPGSEL